MTRSPERCSPRRRPARLLAVLVGIAAVLTGLAVVSTPAASAAIDPCGPSGNKISCENSLPGTPRDVWDIDGAGDASIQGFATDISVNVGQRVDFKVDTAASSYSITIYRTGWYNGDGARRIASVTPSAALPQSQPQCITDSTTEVYDCGNWAVSASWNVPSTAVSGVYIAKLTVPATGASSHITFVVRDDSSHSDVVFQTSDPTWQAYNTYGGSDFYEGAANGRAYKVSYNRPVLTRSLAGGRDFYMSSEFAMVQFLEMNGYDVSYMAGVDTDRNGSLLTNHKTFLSVGHDEYWSGAQRANVEAARDAGVNLQFLSGNEAYWRTRYEASADAGHAPYRTLVSYKETWANSKIDPTNQWTGTWRDPRFAAAGVGGGRPENELTGTAYVSNDSDLPLTVSAGEGRLRLWRNTGLATMSGASTVLADHTIGYESDEDLDNGHRPVGLIRLSTTTGAVPQYLQDFGTATAAGTTTHHLTMYKAPSGALVFGAGTIQWAWGLTQLSADALPPDPRMQQAQVNLFADMGAQPTTLAAGLVAATRSTDTTGPSTSITSPAPGSSTPNGSRITVSGSATDTGGGQVAGVEVSTDGGATWHAASGTTSWQYTYVQHGRGTSRVLVHAMDDSANIGATASLDTSVACDCSVYGDMGAPRTPASGDPGAYELGMRFSPDENGYVSGVRFYKSAVNTGTHTGSLWSSTGQRLATVTFTNETASGWQRASFATAVPVTAGQTYSVSYSAPNGNYAVDSWGFASGPVKSPPLSVAGGFGAPAAGVYAAQGSYPGSSYQNTNYYVDPVFTKVDTSPLVGTDQWPLPGSSSVPSSTTVSLKLSKPVDASSVAITVKDPNGVAVPGTVTYDASSRVATFKPSRALDGFVQYTARAVATDTLGIALTSGSAWTFTTARPAAVPGVCPCSLFADTVVPSVLEAADDALVTLGVKFSSDVSGTVTGVRFYKGAGNTGTHTGTLWSATGTKLAEGTFTGESTSGWQTLTFDAPVAITKGTTYVASYRTTVGRYSVSPNAFADADLSNAPLRVTSGSGAYAYGTGFPANGASSNYLVDVVFERAAPSMGVDTQDPAPGSTDIPRGASVKVSFTDALASGWSMVVKKQPAGTTIAGTASAGSDGSSIVFKPSALLPADSDVSVTLTNVRSVDGASMASQTWTFHTRGLDPPDALTLYSDQIPDVDAADDGSPVELGNAFTTTRSGAITGVRFFKGVGNTGSHVGALWSASGQKLASVTFSGETSRGWQTAKFATPVRVKADTTYVVSYLAPQGHYSYTTGFFARPFTTNLLTAPAENNGRYVYGATGGYPEYSHAATNYFVDVVFSPDAPSIAVASTTPAAGASDVMRSTTPAVSLTAPVAPGYSLTATSGGGTLAGSASTSTDGRTLTFRPSTALPGDADVTMTLATVTSTEGATLPTQTWTFHTESTATQLTSMFPTTTPATETVDDGAAIELGTAFTPSVGGRVTAIRFYKGPGNHGTHTGSVWTANGQRLATVTFSRETTTGWQSADLATPVALSAGQTYVVSYFAPEGGYSATPAFFSSPWTAGPLTAPSTDNGRYGYSSTGGFPTGSFNQTNYLVDVVFRSAIN